MRKFNKRFLSIALFPAYVLAPLLCICMESHAVAAVDHAQALVHSATECCETESADGDHHKSDSVPNDHSSHCSHCDHASFASVSEPVDTLQHSSQQSLLDVLIPAMVRIDGLDRADGFHARSLWLSDPSPPPDLLRVKCLLQI